MGKFRFWPSVAVGILYSTISSAGTIPVVNPSFEDTPPTALLVEQFTLGCGSQVSVANPSGVLRSTPGWTSSSGRAGIIRPGPLGYPAGVPDGNNVAWSEPATLSQSMSTALSPNTRYSLSVAVGNRVTQPSGGYVIGIWAGGQLLSENAGPLPAEGTFAVKTVKYDSPPSLGVGQLLEIRLRATGGPSDQANFDTVSLNSGPACRSDINHDDIVDDSDFVIFVSGYNVLDCADPIMPLHCLMDLNVDGFVDDSDFTLFVVAYNALLCPSE